MSQSRALALEKTVYLLPVEEWFALELLSEDDWYICILGPILMLASPNLKIREEL